MANRTLGSVTTIMKLNNSAFKKGLGNSKKDVNKFSKSMKGLGATIGGAFALRSIARFTLESAKLAATMEGVAKSFDRIQPSIAFLEQLKTATAGTVSELDLMRRSVMASNFKIPLDQLASLLKFATKRAQETGESVDYLVNSIVIGIGRKSPLILDNLGISAVQLRQKLENVGHSGATVGDVAKAVGEIATESLKEMGDVTETTAIKWERLSAEITNSKVELGGYANVLIAEVLPALTRVVRGAGALMTDIKSGPGTWRAMQDQIDFMDTWDQRITELKSNISSIEYIDPFGDLSQEEMERKAINDEIEKQVMLLTESSGVVAEYHKYAIKSLTNWRDGVKGLTVGGIGSYEALNAELKLTKENWEKATTVDGIIAQRLEIIRLEKAIKDLQALGVPLPKVKEILPWTDTMGGGEMGPPEMKLAKGMFTGADGTIHDAFGPKRKREAQEYFESIMDGADDAAAETDKLGKSIGMTLVNQFDQLGQAIGKALSGAAAELASLAQMIMQNIGNILIMAGFAAGPAGLPLIIAGVALQIGQGIWSGIGTKADVPTSGNSYQNSSVNFQISGSNLVGVLDRQNYSNYMNT